MTTRDELIAAIVERYTHAGRGEKSWVLDEFVAVTGFHRKHAMRVLRNGKPVLRSGPRPNRRIYDEAMREALIVFWEASDRVCSKRLRALLPALVGAMERHGHIDLAPEVRSGALAMSAATIDRLLRSVREGAGIRRRRRMPASSAVKRNVPVRTFSDWGDPEPGFFEADLVAHSGPSAAGNFVQSLVLTDIATGWTEMAPMLFREQRLLTEVLSVVRSQLPMPLLGFDTDNDSVFMNETVQAYCEAGKITFTRCRPYRKNDQAWVEQKNGAVVRKIVGYRRYDGIEAATMLANLYAVVRLFVNFFQPSFKLSEKIREGARVTKRYYPPATPCQRLMAHPRTTEAVKQRLLAMEAGLDPVDLLARMRTLQGRLADLADGVAVSDRRDGSVPLEDFLIGLRTAWKTGEVRPTTKIAVRPRRTYRTRIDPFASVASDLDRRFAAAPEQTGRELFEQLQAERPGAYPVGLLRTFQRRLKGWRHERAKDLVFGITDTSSNLHHRQATRTYESGEHCS